MSKRKVPGVEAVRIWRMVQSRSNAREDATMRRCDRRLSAGRRALRSGGRVPTLAVLDWTDEAGGGRIASGLGGV